MPEPTTILTPSMAATLADYGYKIRLDDDVAKGLQAAKDQDKDKLEASENGGQQFYPSYGLAVEQHWDFTGNAISGRALRNTVEGDKGFVTILRGKPGTKHQNDVAVICRGTADPDDGLCDLNLAYVSHEGGYVHRGFYQCYDTVRREVRKQIAAISASGLVHFVGHSLGGALATLLAHEYAKSNGSKARLYTFGSPRVGTSGFNASFNLSKQQIFRVYNPGDIVPMVPALPYHHKTHETEAYCVTDGPLLKCHSMDWYRRGVMGVSDWDELKKCANLDNLVSDRIAESIIKGSAEGAVIGNIGKRAFAAVMHRWLNGAGRISSGVARVGSAAGVGRVASAVGPAGFTGGAVVTVLDGLYMLGRCSVENLEELVSSSGSTVGRVGGAVYWALRGAGSMNGEALQRMFRAAYQREAAQTAADVSAALGAQRGLRG